MSETKGEIKTLYALYLSLREEIKEIEETMVGLTEMIFAQTRAILISKSRVDRLIAAYCKLLEKLSADRKKECDKKVEEVIDIITSRQKYKM